MCVCRMCIFLNWYLFVCVCVLLLKRMNYDSFKKHDIGDMCAHMRCYTFTCLLLYYDLCDMRISTTVVFMFLF